MCAVPGFGGPAERDLALIVKQWLEGDAVGSGGEGPAAFAEWSLEQAVDGRVRALSAGLLDADGRRPPQGESGVLKAKIDGRRTLAEQRRIEGLLKVLAEGVRLRLDANQSMDLSAAACWLEWIGRHPQVEFIEQPMAVGSESRWLEEFGGDAAKIALDESVASRADFSRLREEGWPGYFVLKPMLFGDPRILFSLPAEARKRVVLSSVFESGIGFARLLQLATAFGPKDFRHGFGTRGFLRPREMDGWGASAGFSGRLGAAFFEKIWNHALDAAA